MMSDAERWDHSGYSEMIKEENSKLGNTKKGFFGKYDKGSINNQNDKSVNYDYNDQQNYKKNHKKFPYNGNKFTTDDWNSDKMRSEINGVGNIKNLKQRKIRKENSYFPENPNSEISESSHHNRFYNINDKDENQFEPNSGQNNMYKKGGNNFQHNMPGNPPHQNNFYQRKKPYQNNHNQYNNTNIIQKSPQGNINSNPVMFNHYDPKMMMAHQNNFAQQNFNQMGMHHLPFNANYNNYPVHYNTYKFKDNTPNHQNMVNVPNMQNIPSNNINISTGSNGGSKNNSNNNITMSSNLNSSLNPNNHSGFSKIVESPNQRDSDGESEGKLDKTNVLNEKGRDKRQFMNVINTIKSNTLQNFQNKINLNKNKQNDNFSTDPNISISVIDENGNISNSTGHNLNSTMNSSQNITPRRNSNQIPQTNSLPYQTGTIPNFSPQGPQMGANFYSSPIGSQVTDPMMMHNFQQNNNMSNPSKFMNMNRMNMMNMNNNIGNNMNINMKGINSNMNTNQGQPFYGMIPVPMIDPNQMNNFNPNMYGKFPYMNNQIKSNSSNSDINKIQHSHSMGYEDIHNTEPRQNINFHSSNNSMINNPMQKFNNRSNQGTPNSNPNQNPMNHNSMYIKNNTVNFNSLNNNVNRNFRINEGTVNLNKNLPKKNMFQRGKFSSEKNLIAHTIGNFTSETNTKKQSISNLQKTIQPTQMNVEQEKVEQEHSSHQDEEMNPNRVPMYVSVRLAERDEVICINPGANLHNIAREFLNSNKLDDSLHKPLTKMIEKGLETMGNIFEAKLDTHHMKSLIKLGHFYKVYCNEENSTSSELDRSYRTDSCSFDMMDNSEPLHLTIAELKEVERLNVSQ